MSSSNSNSNSRLKELQTRVSTLTSELELSTFLNKGILQTNSEHKIRIAELEQENAILRAAESRLAETEDLLEMMQKRCKGVEVDIRRERLERDRVESEREEWKGRCEGWRKRWQGVKKIMEEGLEVEVGLARQSAVRPRQSKVPERISTPSPDITGGLRKRRRVPDTSSELSEEEGEAEPLEKLRAQPKRGRAVVKTPAKPARPSIPFSARKPSPKVKMEEKADDSDDDPLAMS